METALAERTTVYKEFEPAELSITPNVPRTVVSWVSTDIVDHVGDVVVAEGVDVKSAFMDKNPVILALHDNKKWPVGLGDHIKVKNGNGFTGLMGVMHFDIDPDAERLFGLVKRGVVRGQSIGFVRPTDLKPGEWGPPTADEIAKHPHWKNARCVIRRCVLVEWSFVPVPMNKESLVLYVEKGLPLPSFLQSTAEKIMAETNGATLPALPGPQAKAADDKKPKPTEPAAATDDAEKSAMCKAVADVASKVKHSGDRGHAYYNHGEKAVHHDMAGADDGDEKYDQAGTIKGMYKACKGVKKVTVGVEDGHPGDGYEKVFPAKKAGGKTGDAAAEDDGKTDEEPADDKKGLKAGDFVKFCGSRKGCGCVMSVHKDGDMVPDVEDDVQGTEDEPAARVRCYKAYGGGHKATDLHVAHPVKDLEKIADLKPPADKPRKAAKGFDASLPTLPDSTNLPTLPTMEPVIKTLAEAFSPANIERGIQRAKDQLTGKLSF